MRILFIRYKKTNQIFEGGEQCAQQHLDAYRKIVGENQVTVYYIHDETKPKYAVTKLFSYGIGAIRMFSGYFFGLSSSRISEIVAMAQNYDIVHIDRSIFGIIAKALKETNYKGKIISFFHNVEVPYFQAKLSSQWKQKLENFLLRCVDKNDAYTCKYSDKIITLNQRDSDEIFKRYHRKTDAIIPISFQDKLTVSPSVSELTCHKPKCLFLGTYFTPNNEGIDWFLREVYPFVSIQITIVGKGMNQLSKHYKIPTDVKIASDVPDLTPYLTNADAMILPIFTGSGMKVKTCESLMYGRNIYGTDEAFIGYDIDTEKVGAKCNTAEDFIRALRLLSDNPRPKFNSYSRKIFLKNYSTESSTERFKKILNE